MPSKPETVINATIELLEQAAQICQEQGEYWGQLRLSLNQCYTDCAHANSAIGMALGDTLSYDSSDSGRSASAAIAEAKDHHDDALSAHKHIASNGDKLQKIVAKSLGELKQMASNWPAIAANPNYLRAISLLSKPLPALNSQFTYDLTRCRTLIEKAHKEAREVAADSNSIVSGAAFALKNCVQEASMLYMSSSSNAAHNVPLARPTAQNFQEAVRSLSAIQS